jgi:hypothetical protein
MHRTRRRGAVPRESRRRIALQLEQLRQLQPTARYGADQFAHDASGLTLCETDTTTYRRFTFFVKPQPGSLYACACAVIRVRCVRAVAFVCTNHLRTMLSLW